MAATATASPQRGPVRSSLLRVAGAGATSEGLIQTLLREQKTLTAVEQFATKHHQGELPAQARYYRDLVPATPPGPGQQYSFEVDLDACTGCKACVAACHSLNGLDDGEVWRTVGALFGGTSEAPAIQTVTTSCHHCVEPACMTGCPVQAYEKDPVTGIVKHLDDQCIGCQYCTFMCPYDAPKYSKSLGIVRKCDMCSSRLSHGEAPACVQGCPNEAIKIKIVDQVSAVESCQTGTFLPGAPTPEHTVPTTVYKSNKAAPRNLLPADFYSVSPEHAHLPLVVLLVLTQLAAGAFTGGWAIKKVLGWPDHGIWALGQAVVAFGFVAAALAVSVLHLGRPQGMWRVFLGLKTSWMSREAIVLGGFAGAGATLALSLGLPYLPLPPALAVLAKATPIVEAGAVVMGLVGVFCSVMVYVATRRAHWQGSITGLKFFGTTLLLGAATVNAVTWAGGRWLPASAHPPDLLRIGRGLLWVVVLASAAKLLYEAAGLLHLRSRKHTVMKRVAILMTRDLRTVTMMRFVCGATGGVFVPLMWLAQPFPTVSLEAAVTGIVVFGLILIGEFLERALYFAAAPPSRMPGGLS